jgi:hypothetical protein
VGGPQGDQGVLMAGGFNTGEGATFIDGLVSDFMKASLEKP